MKYDVLLVGAGLFNAVIAYEARKKGLTVLVLERRNHIGGNCYTESIEGINVHVYGAHIFRTSNKAVWRYMEQFCEFNNFINSPIANYHGELYNLPFNMNTFHALWGVATPEEAREAIERTRVPNNAPTNLEEQVLNLAGRDIYQKLVKGYTEKQWGKKSSELPPSIMRRIPLRFTYDNNYFNDPMQGIPKGGYTAVFQKMFEGSEIKTGVDYLKERARWDDSAGIVIYSGPVDEFYSFIFGPLEYRSLRFEHKIFDSSNYQGVAVMNYTDSETPYTRSIEHKHFEFGVQEKTVVSYEYPCEWHLGIEPYYPMEDKCNLARFEQYKELISKESHVRFGGRLGEYKYYDMQDTVQSALSKSREWL